MYSTSLITDKFDIAHLERKKYKSSSKSVKRVVSIEYARDTKTQCIEVTDSEHLYITDGYSVTHNTVKALQNRLEATNTGFTTVWGEDPNPKNRAAAQEKFWSDPNCRILIGTRAIEQSLNLQVSRHLINIDMIMNPARMEQLAGRIRRDGSAYQHVFVHNLLTINTQEERYLPHLEREAALSSHIWDESSELFSALDSQSLLRLISG